jgi:hypothetical protein
MFEQKRFAGRHLLTFESQKLKYFGKKGRAGVFISMIIMYYEYMTTQYFVRFFLSIKTQVRIILGRTVLLLNSVHIA